MSLGEFGGSPHSRRAGRRAKRIRCGELGEDRLLGQLLFRLSLTKAVINGPGDDCAVVEIRKSPNFLVLKTDCVVSGVHFLPAANALEVGWKAMMRPLSDFAATSAVPQFALITLIAPEQTKVEWVKALYRGLRRAAKQFKVSIVGGELSSTRGPAAISVSVAGFVERDRCVSRRGGKAGDDLFVTGRLGGALKQKHLRFVPRIAESRWLTKNFSIHAMMDLSDGLGADLPRLARASRVRFAIEMENLPVARSAKIKDAISEGEDYELLFAISPRERTRLERAWQRKFPKVPLTRIGFLSRPSTKSNQLLSRGYVHFQKSSRD
jgi:thiamine-monophosphate kinase